jgi:hypothetical protein
VLIPYVVQTGEHMRSYVVHNEGVRSILYVFICCAFGGVLVFICCAYVVVLVLILYVMHMGEYMCARMLCIWLST